MIDFSFSAQKLFELIPPRKLRQHLQELYFRYMTESKHPDALPEISESVYFLVQFLDEVEEGMGDKSKEEKNI